MTAVCRLQNTAARLITPTGRREHISPVQQELHWLQVRPTPWGLETGNSDVPVATRRTVVSLRRVQVAVYARPVPSMDVCINGIVQTSMRHHMRHTVVQNSSGRQVV